MKRWLKPFVTLLVLLLLAEEWLWDHLKRCVARLGALPGVRAFEARLRALPPWASLAVMLLPAAVLLPFKLAALWALGHGHRVLGLLVFVAAKLVGTGLAAYLFDLVRDSARQVKAFDRFYGAVMRLLARAHAWLHAQPLYRSIRAQAQAWRQAWRQRRGAARSVWARRKVALKRHKR
ncbi:hypothetical protein [Inhella crocodyli]|uniref:Transmembrane protein n=1 Tax=Inhella crocodyli TaxID=2499851 RepID=A0A3S2UF01_9BURK|nr:hypothetical protein [Inhella crocodyli]RVT86197.1 hypothetical protein EOD73_09180 [Inhella crocodyli]